METGHAVFHLTRIRDDRHRLHAVVGSRVLADVELESRSFLTHDLSHMAVEASVPLAMGFWGHLAAGVPLDDLATLAMGPATHADLVLAEQLSGPFQARAADRLTRQRWVELAAGILPVPGDAARVHDEAMEKMQALQGAWRATRVGGTLVLSWPYAPPRVEGP